MTVKKVFRPGQTVKVIVESNRNCGRVGQVDKYSASGKSVWVDLGDAIGVQRFAENSLEAVRGARMETGRSGWKEKTQRMSVGKGDEQRVESGRAELALVELLEQMTQLVRITADQIEGRTRG